MIDDLLAGDCGRPQQMTDTIRYEPIAIPIRYHTLRFDFRYALRHCAIRYAIPTSSDGLMDIRTRYRAYNNLWISFTCTETVWVLSAIRKLTDTKWSAI